MRLDKFLADHEIGTRSEVKKILAKGCVCVNGLIIKDPKTQVTNTDQISVSGTLIETDTKKRYYMFHKPAGCVSAKTDACEQTVMDFFRNEPRWQELCIVGRLDKDTEGLLIVTDDGAYCHTLISPKKHIPKTYYFETDAPLCEEAEKIAGEGMTLRDKTKCSPAKLEMIDESKGMLTIYEGAYHQVKRMVSALGGHVCYLKRMSIGNLMLDESLPIGTYRRMTEEETWQAICQSPKKNSYSKI